MKEEGAGLGFDQLDTTRIAGEKKTLTEEMSPSCGHVCKAFS